MARFSREYKKSSIILLTLDKRCGDFNVIHHRASKFRTHINQAMKSFEHAPPMEVAIKENQVVRAEANCIDQRKTGSFDGYA